MEYQFEKEPGCLTKLANRAIPVFLALVILVIAAFIATAGAPWLSQLLTEMGVF